MVYIIIPKIYEDAFLYTSNDDYKQIHIKNYDFTIGNYIFFHFNQKNIDFIIQKKDYIILDNHPIIIKNDFMMNYSEEINNITVLSVLVWYMLTPCISCSTCLHFIRLDWHWSRYGPCGKKTNW